MLAYRFQFVKNFFQVFSNFFSIRFLSCRSRDSFDIISLHIQFVNTFFREITFILKLYFIGLLLVSFLSFRMFPDHYIPFPAILCSLYAGVRFLLASPEADAWMQDSNQGHSYISIGSRQKKNRTLSSAVCVGVTYLPGPSPAKYCRRL